MSSDLTQLRQLYHKIIEYEYEKYQKTGQLGNTFFTREEICNILEIDEEIFRTLINEGFIIETGHNRFHSLLMDIAYRAADIRIKYGGTKYILESSLDLQLRPFLNLEFIKFDVEDPNLHDLKREFSKILPEEFVGKFIEALEEAGLKGLSKYQFLSILQFLREKKDTVICAPTAFGKTFIFLLPILLFVIKNVMEEKKGTFAILFYPRKSLGSDQMGRFIRLIQRINMKLGIEITIGIDDGEVKSRRDFREVEEYRGIKCPIHSDEKLLIKNGKVFCQKCSKPIEFIVLTREDFRTKPPNILITNIWAYQFRLCDPLYWKNGYLSKNIEFFVFDEIHAYRSIVAGTLRYFIRLLRSLVSEKARFVFSSATIPKLEEFVQEVSGLNTADFTKLIYDEKIHGVDGNKLELYLLLGVHPFTSWETYTHELAIFLSTINRIRPKKNLQSLIFVDGIRNISRLYTQALEAIKLGDPRDHLHAHIPPDDPFCYWVYNKDYRLIGDYEGKLDELRNLVMKNIETHYSDKADRFEVEERIKSGNVDVVFTTSTLELGVDYDNITVVVNTGIPFSLESIIQRVGRAGRNEEKTLYSSLCIVIVRNNPLEYFYIYKGIRELTDINKIPKIPVSFSNIFVVFYSALLYMLAYSAKNGENLLKLRGSKELIKTIVDKLDVIHPQVVQELGIGVNILDVQKKLKEIAEVILEPDVEKKFEDIKSWKEKTWLLYELSSYIDELENFLSVIENETDKLSEREKPSFKKEINYIKSELSSWKKGNLQIIAQSIEEVIHSLMTLRNNIRTEYHPFYPFKKDLIEFYYRLDKYLEPNIRTISKMVSGQKISDKEFTNFYKAEEIYKKLSEHPINLLESIIGFKFMGLEFIDQSVVIGAEHHTPSQKKDEFLSNIISRTPPFELITIPFEEKSQKEITDKVGARHFWLIKPLRGFYLYPQQAYEEIAKDGIMKGRADKYKDLLIPSEINFVDALTLDKPLILKMVCKDGKPLYIKYGSEKLATSKVDGKYSLCSNIRKLYSFEPANNLYYVIRERTLSYLQRIDREIQNSGDRWGLNFRYPFLCLLGYCVSVDPFDKKCPIKEKCNIIGCDGSKHWTGALGKRRIYPKFHMTLNVRNLPQIAEPLIYNIGTLTYDELREEIEFVYDAATVYLPTRFNDYLLREFEIAPIGYLARTSLVYIIFNEKLLDTILSILLKEQDMIDLLKFKFYMFKKLKEKHSAIDAALEYVKYDPKKIEIETKEFAEFVKDCLLHTFAHLFFIFLVTKKVQLDPEKITYFITHNTIYVLENSKNDGMGFVETIRNEIKSVGEKRFIEEFIDWAEDLLRNHTRHAEAHLKALTIDSRNYLSKLRGTKIFDKIEDFHEKIKELNQKINSYVKLNYIDIVTYRHILSHELITWEEYSDEISEYILPVIHSEEIPKLCTDGCEDCLIFYRGCNNPFLQNYTISKILVTKFLNIIKRGHVSLIGKGLGELLENFMKKSERIIVNTPFIDEYGLSILRECKDKGIDIEVVTRSDNLNIVNELQKCGIKVRFTLSHAKMYIFEAKNQVVCAHGSMNLTRSSFVEKEENIVILWDDTEIRKAIMSSEG
ncbi:MAG: DEAD/DEAH box helicase [Candidatus Aenigmarchaeota archaeon]|nr:DEAD/DEAH box helicase [Candidatus Aenigmarchaeota archaeon]